MISNIVIKQTVISTQLNGFMHHYITLTIQFKHTVISTIVCYLMPNLYILNMISQDIL